MRWRHKIYQEGDQRLVKRFLWLPLTLKDETRWLEKARIAQVLVHKCDGVNHFLAWENTQFYDPGERIC